MAVTTVNQAYELFYRDFIAGSPHDFVCLTDRTQERDFGWVFFYDSRQHLETRNPSFMVPGTAPVVVTREGKVVPITSSMPPAQGIAAYEKAWRAEHGLK